jgi:phage host-nuclease inhibitor protein Gam
MKLLPANIGFRGNVETAMCEAKATEFDDVRRLVSLSLRDLFKGQDRYVDIYGFFPDQVVANLNGRFYAYGYTLTEGNQVILGQPTEVVKTYTPVNVTNVTEALDDYEPVVKTTLPEIGEFLREALDTEKGLKWRVRVCQAGLSGNKNNYPPTVLREAAPLFNGVRVFCKSDEDHLTNKGKDFKNLIGNLTNAQFVEAVGTEPAHVEADLNLLESGGVHTKMLECWNRGMKDLFGFSINAFALTKKVKNGNTHMVEAQKFTSVKSLDLIIEPGAGGTLLNLLEAKGANPMLLQQMIEAIRKHRPAMLKGVDESNEEAVLAVHSNMLEAMANPAPAAKSDHDEHHLDNQRVTQTQLTEALATQRAHTHAATVLGNSKLPEPAKAQLRKQFAGETHLTEAKVDAALADMQTLVGAVSKSGHIKMDNVVHGNVDDGKQLLEAFFDPEDRSVTSIREAYLNCTGDTRFTGRFDGCSKTRLAEALDSGSFTDALGEAMHKRLLDLYGSATIYDAWRQLVDIVPVNDFRNQERVSIGGYGDLPTVGESGAYAALSSPSDGKEAYAIAKKGGTESFTLEMIANDDVGAILRMPGKLNDAAKRTLSKFVFNMFVTNPAMNDGNAWFHASHNNLGTAALSSVAYTAGRLAMMRQVEPGSNAELGIMPKVLMVPADLEEAAYNLFNRNTNLDKTFAQSLNPDILPVWCWTDATDWVMACDKNSHPIIELGFFQGREEPELFIQDNPNVGSMFTNDKVTYKIRHIYGGAPLSFMGVRKNVVA